MTRYKYVNGLSDHDAQIISLNKINLTPKQKAPKIKLRLINDTTISSFQKLLKEETWNQIYDASDINETFNALQYSFLRYFEANFPITYRNRRSKQNNWITKVLEHPVTKRENSLPNTEETQIIFKQKTTTRNTVLY